MLTVLMAQQGSWCLANDSPGRRPACAAWRTACRSCDVQRAGPLLPDPVVDVYTA
jgi:hypothetical protein